MKPPIKELSYVGEWQSFDPGLARIEEGLTRLGQPHLQWRHFLVGGTNGKGTVSFNLARNLGPGTGLFTSPHLIDVRERITLAGTPFPDRAWIKARDRIREVWPNPRLSYFEWLLLLAVIMFHEASVEDAVFEVGMGGRLDATNALSPGLSILTQVSMDHQQFLGDSLESIALEKIEIARQGKPFFFPEVLLDFEAVKSRMKAIGCLAQPIALTQAFESNLVLLNKILEHLNRTPQTSLELLPGRREKVREGLYLDGAHNQAGWRDLCRWIQAEKRQPIAVLGSLSQGRQPDLFLKELTPIASKFFHWQAGFDKELPREHWPTSVDVIGEDRLPFLLDRPLLVCGSLYFVGAFKQWYHQHFHQLS